MKKEPQDSKQRGRLPAGRILVLFLAFCAGLYLFHVLPTAIVHSTSGLGDAKAEALESKSKDASISSASKKKAEPAPSVTVYITSWCPACSMTMDYLKKKNIPFTAKDIEKNPAYLREMVGKVGAYRGVPVLDINGKTYLGFNPSIIDDLAK